MRRKFHAGHGVHRWIECDEVQPSHFQKLKEKGLMFRQETRNLLTLLLADDTPLIYKPISLVCQGRILPGQDGGAQP